MSATQVQTNNNMLLNNDSEMKVDGNTRNSVNVLSRAASADNGVL